MGLSSTQGLAFKLVANGEILDLFTDEQIFLSDNVTGLFDLGVLPADFTRQITLPGTKKNNAFFEHVYDISVYSPDIFATNQLVNCYLDFDGIYLAQGYLQLNKVNVVANKFIDSYEISIYGAVSSFAREVSRSFLTDMTSSLAQFNHSASLENITGSWEGKLFSGSIVYPMAEYGQKILYSASPTTFGIDDPSGSLFVQDYKPAIKVKEVWDAIFNEYGYTYSSSFWQEPFLNSVYLVCNNALRYPQLDSINLETYGLFKIGPVSGSTDIQFTNSVTQSFLPFYNVQTNPANNIDPVTLAYSIDYDTKLRGYVNLSFEVSASGATPVVPQFTLVVKDGSSQIVAESALTQVNTFMQEIYYADLSQGVSTAVQKYTVLSEFNTEIVPSGSYQFFMDVNPFGSGTLTTFIAPDGDLKSYIEVTKVGNVGEGQTVNIGANMPFGTKGIKKIDFITGLQKKFNLVMYPSKTKPREFIVETFNNWYNKGRVWDFNQFVNLNEKLEVVPANNLAVNELNFGDLLDNDYVSQQFSKEANREYGKTYYIDTQNFFSQGNFEVKTAFASSPLIYLQNTGVSGSAVTPDYTIYVEDQYWTGGSSFCLGNIYSSQENRTYATLLDQFGNPVINYGSDISVVVNYTVSGCGGGQFFQGITIPYGSSTGYYQYTSQQYVDCGFGCEQETITPDCVLLVSQYSLDASSPIPLC